jgi:TPR repeat protein
MRRGNEMLNLGDYAAARLLFGRAAQAGHADAMLALGRTYDPASVDSRVPKPGLDREAAIRWYTLAAAAGSQEAADALQQLRRRASR